MNNLDDKAKEFINLILSSTNVVALTGAGISTESGIPDYRSPGTGLWGKMDQSVVSLDGFLRDPTRYYSYALELYPVRQSAKPNPAHYLLAEFEKKELLKGVITQNVDGLHQDAGSGNVHELHGSLRQAVCLDCSLLYPMDSVMKRVISGENPPLCKECSGVLKPNAVFFGEMLPHVPWERSLELTRKTDLFLVLGSSLQVSPANMLPDVALRAGTKLVIINLTPTPYDRDAVLIIRDKVGDFASLALQYFRSEVHT
ncbi:Sir2 family NAD-dependent protein deacetylase [Desulfobacterota bacterium AH_259_B03_O07]|nr:Sir2 family NAD-dependent protein deacetylase [Desulfobacterota bacterium AH_259_B03_O07]